MNKHEIIIDKFETVSFFEDTTNDDPKIQPNFFEGFFQENALLYYYLIISFTEYLIFHQLMLCYQEGVNQNFRLFLFFLGRVISFIGLTDILFKSPQEFMNELTNYKTALQEVNVKLELGFHLLLWLIFWNLGDYFLVTNILILYRSKMFYQTSLQIFKGYPLNNSHYKFMIIFGIYIICNLIHNRIQSFQIVLLLFSGFLFYIKDDFQTLYSNIIQQNFSKHIAFGLLSVFFFINYLLGDKSGILNFSNLLFFIWITLISFSNTYIIIRLKKTSCVGNSQNYNQTLILYIVLTSFCLDCFLNQNAHTYFSQYLFTLIGVASIVYINKSSFQELLVKRRKHKINLIDNQL